MRKITLLCLAARRDETVSALRGLGVLHVVDVQAPGGETLEETENRLERAARVLRVLETAASEADVPAKAPKGDAAEAEETVNAGMEVLKERERIDERVQTLRFELARVEAFGDFDPEALQTLCEEGVETRLYRAAPGSPPAAPEGTAMQIFRSDKAGVWFVLTGPSEAFPETFPASELEVPAESPSRMREEIEELLASRAEGEKRLQELSAQREAVRALLEQEEEQRRFLAVREGMGKAEAEETEIAYLEGFCPAEDVEALQEAAARNGWGLLVRKPESDEDAPTLVRYPKWVKPIKAVFDFLQIAPGYREADISMVFLLFFSVFFGMLIGDAGYGTLFLLATVGARIKFPKAPVYPFALFVILSLSTMIWGALTGNYFGIASSVLPAPLRGLSINWLTGENSNNNIMGLCFLIGAIHLTIAHLWNTLALWPAKKAFEQIGWICVVWAMFFTARALVLREAFPVWMYWVLGAGIVLIILFMTPVERLKEDFVLHLMLPLSVVSCFVDIVSYVRLFAVGMASYSVASSFNNMALEIGAGSVLAGLGASLVLLLGHGLNIALCALGILVHGVRLNTLEFSMHKQMTWSGFPYSPFGERKKHADL